jgi:hypothetical protein
MSDKVCNVFISHIHEDDDGVSRLKSLLADHGCDARDSSINSSNPNNAKNHDYIKSDILAPQIAWAGTLIVLVTPGTKSSEWVNWEIEYAFKLGKRIVGVWDNGDMGCDVPEALDKYANAVVPWRGEQVTDAIFGKIEEWRNPDGTVRSLRDTARYSCG